MVATAATVVVVILEMVALEAVGGGAVKVE